MKNGIFKIDLASIADAALTAAIVSVGTAAVAIVTAPGFDVFALNWVVVFHNSVNLAIVAAVVSLGQDFLSTNNGSVLGITPNTTPAA